MITIAAVLTDFWPLAGMSNAAFFGSAMLAALELGVEIVLLASALS